MALERDLLEALQQVCDQLEEDRHADRKVSELRQRAWVELWERSVPEVPLSSVAVLELRPSEWLGWLGSKGGLAVMLKLQFKAANSDGFPSMKHLLLNGSSVNIDTKDRYQGRFRCLR